MKNINSLSTNEITELIEKGLEILIKGFENIGFRKNTKQELKEHREQIALLSKKVLELENKIG